MKCPKCDYLGFETGDRCKNCGYDFSLLAAPSSSPPAPHAMEIDVPSQPVTPGFNVWLGELDKALDAPEPRAAATAPAADVPRQAAPLRADAALPLFTPREDDDEPLIKLPVAPRPPLAVRKTPDIRRLRAMPKPPPRIEEPVLDFPDETAPTPELTLHEPRPAEPAAPPVPIVAAGAAARAGAAAIDHAILFAIDAAVVYFTARIAGLSPSEWRTLPLPPLVAFLLFLKVSYFWAFTAVGGQTIGKMAAGLRVVTDAGEVVDPACALRRTLAGLLSGIVFGLGFLPALVGAERRALHDRAAGTRVVARHSA